MGSTRLWQFLIVAGAVASGAIAITSAQQFTDWSPPVNLGPVVNSAFNDQQPSVSPDGLSLYFASNRPGGTGGGVDLWVTQRDSLEDPWQTPVPLPSTVNSPGAETTPALSPDGHLLFFSSTRPDGCGSWDIWVSVRKNKRDDFGWQVPVHLGCVVNGDTREEGPAYVEDEQGGATLYFHSFGRSGGFGFGDIWASTINADGTPNPPVNVIELNSPFNDLKPTVRRGGEEIIFTSNRSGNFDLWVATRDEQSPVWSVPQNLGAIVNSTGDESAPALSRDGRSLFFQSFRPGVIGGFDLYVSTRTKVHP